MELTEQQLVTQIIHYLNAKGHFVWRNNSGVVSNSYTGKDGVTKHRRWRAGIKGGSDIIGIAKSGKFIAIECKVGKNKTTALQNMFLEDIFKRNGYAITAYSLDDVIDTLEGLGENE